MTNVLVDGELILYGDVGEDGFWGLDGFTARDVVGALAQLRGKPVTVRINSGGGITDEGVAIYNSLRSHGQKITVHIDSGCSSAASLIAMAGDQIIMRTGTYLMIHEPQGAIYGGTQADFEAEARGLYTQAEGYAAIYAARTKKPAAEMRALMKLETWMTPEKAVELGFADQVSNEPAVAIAAFDYSSYRNTPAQIMAIASAKDWKAQRARIIARKKEIMTMPDPNPTPDPARPNPPANPTPTPSPADPPAPGTGDAQAAIAAERGRVSQIMALAQEHEVPMTVAQEMVNAGASVAMATQRFTAAADIRKSIARANKICPSISLSEADRFIAAGTPLAEVNEAMLAKIEQVAASTSIDTSISGANAGSYQPPAANPALDKMIAKVVADTQRSLGAAANR